LGGGVGVSWGRQRVRVRVPATSANLGPGFDALGLALALYDEVTAGITDSGLTIEVSGEGAGASTAGEGHLVVRAMRAAFGAVAGGQPPGLTLSCVNAIPQGRGLGSSAGAVVAGLLAAQALAGLALAGLPQPGDGEAEAPEPGGGREPGRFVDGALLALAAELEGHPDNAAACLAGGLTIAWNPEIASGDRGGPGPDSSVDSAGGPRAVRLEPLAVIVPVVCVPATAVATAKARRALPETIPHRDAATNAGRSALLIAALTQDSDLLFDATHDLLHEPYRAPLMPASADLIGRLRHAGIAAVLSGAGPTVLALTVQGRTPGLREVDSIAVQTGTEWHVSPLDVDRQGATIQSVPSGVRIRTGARHGRYGYGLRQARAGHVGWSLPDQWSASAKNEQRNTNSSEECGGLSWC
jgi:homoserine kinase